MRDGIPDSMTAVQVDAPNSLLQIRQLPIPQPKKGQVLVRMSAVPINPSDLIAISGFSYKGERRYPFTLGLEGSGTVVQTGGSMYSRTLIGRRVACSIPVGENGTWSEYVLTSEMLCVPLSKHVDFDQGSMLLANPLTAIAVIDMVRAGNHQALINTAAAGALGTMIIRMGKRNRIPIINVVRRKAQADVVRARGGENVLCSSDSDFDQQLSALVKKHNATLFLDAVGGDITRHLVDVAPYASTIVLYSRLSPELNVFDGRTVAVKHLTVKGWFLPNWINEKRLPQQLMLFRKAQSLLNSDLRTYVHRRLPLKDAQSAVDEYAKDMSVGKTLLMA